MSQLNTIVTVFGESDYRFGPVNSKSFVGHFFLQIKRIFKLKILF